jgi:putative DNA primase/helicase
LIGFHQFAQAHGLLIRDLRADGQIHRVPTASKPRSINGAYMFENGRGWCMDWQNGDRVHWWQDENARPWTPEEKAAAEQRQRNAARERAQRAAKAAQQARELLQTAQLVTPRPAAPWRPGRQAVEAVTAHPYLTLKGFPNESGLVASGELLIPMFDCGTYRQVMGIQRISTDGSKKFMSGQRARGAIHRFGNGQQRECWLVEGYATGLTVREALRRLYRPADIVVCFSASNLVHVAGTGIGTHVVADNDASCVGYEAAMQTGLPFWMSSKVGEDFNDFYLRVGMNEAASVLLEAACRKS